MPIVETFSVALEALRANKLRSLLTMLGIVIGVSAVIAMLALGRGAQQSVKDRIAQLGTTMLTVVPGQQRGPGSIASATERARLTLDDAQALEDRGKVLAAVQPEMVRAMQVVFGNHNTNTNIVGTTPNYLMVRRYAIEYGRMFAASENAAGRMVAVLGPQVADDLGAPSGAVMVGETIRINGAKFLVIGVLAEKGQTGGNSNPDDQILIPLQAAQSRLIGRDRLRTINVLAPSEDQIPATMAEISRILRRSHRLRPGQPDFFTIRNQADFLVTLGETTQVFTWLLAGIAAVSLLVGGIGIMNIMLVSVTERTREIGIRKALGATPFVIMVQFLIEAVVLCLLGGTVGIGVGTTASAILHRTMDWNTSVGAPSILMAFAFAAAVGILFGVWPARRASVLDPIEALRYE
ncbi:MAG: FtsX-like permease family protein [Candidatus Eisenbacteria bacterium]|uniref:FtsX-like permease family protein n=1 Tax=Eiseniibacteriota bacterium TaxID=2212470 RepID=A0A538SZS3_UNCEI|nr:MAG: FtsX-like permease family protein [Candidatus Eisenbacteria bacterium]